VAEISDQEYQEYQLYKEAQAEEERIANEPGFFKKLITQEQYGGYGRNSANTSKKRGGGLKLKPNPNVVPTVAEGYIDPNAQSNIAGGGAQTSTPQPLPPSPTDYGSGLLAFSPEYKKLSPIEQARLRRERGKYIWNPKLRAEINKEQHGTANPYGNEPYKGNQPYKGGQPISAGEIDSAPIGNVTPQEIDDVNIVMGRDGREYKIDEFGAPKTPEYFGLDGEGISKENYDEMIAGGDMQIAGQQAYLKNQWLHRRGLDPNSLAMSNYDASLAEARAEFDENQLMRHSQTTIHNGNNVQFVIGAGGQMIDARTGETLLHSSGQPRIYNKELYYTNSMTPGQKIDNDGNLIDAYGGSVTDQNGNKVKASSVYPELLSTNETAKINQTSLEDQVEDASSPKKDKDKDDGIDYEKRGEIVSSVGDMLMSIAGGGIQI
jgi:hypothetical protein